MTIHAHPDDEASKGAPTVAMYARQGVSTILVCCTGGEEGDVNNPALVAPGGALHGLDETAVQAELARLRPLELACSAAAIGFDEVIMLGYRDSGMAQAASNNHPDSFHSADLDEAVGRLVAHIRRTRPQVIITYGDEQSAYPHPDHLKVHDISGPAFDRAGDEAWYPEAGPPWQPLKMYYSTWSRARIDAWHAAFGRLGLESPYDDNWFNRPWQDDRITTRLPITHDMWMVRQAALLAHETQIDPTERFWFGLPSEAQWEAYPWEDWILARSLVGSPGDGEIEDDLFSGVTAAQGNRR
jgi:mycothiol S-conjugate amidase